MTARSLRTPLQPMAPLEEHPPSPPPKVDRNPKSPLQVSPQAKLDESVPAVYFTASRNHPPDDRGAAGWLRRLPPASRVRASSGGLSHDSGSDLLTRRQPRCHGFFRHRPAGAPVRPNPRLEPDDLHEFLWQLHHHASIQSRSQH